MAARNSLSALKLLWAFYRKYKTPKDLFKLLRLRKDKVRFISSRKYRVNLKRFGRICVVFRRYSRKKKRKLRVSKIKLEINQNLTSKRSKKGLNPWLSGSEHKREVMILVDPAKNLVYFFNKYKVDCIFINLKTNKRSTKGLKTYYLRYPKFKIINYIVSLIRGRRKLKVKKRRKISRRKIIKVKKWLVPSLLSKLLPNRYAAFAKLVLKFNQHLLWKFVWERYSSSRWRLERKVYAQYSRWLRARHFSKLALKGSSQSYRKLSKDSVFNKLFKANLLFISGMTETELWSLWLSVRRGFNVTNIETISTFHQALMLKLDSLLVFLHLVPNRPLSQEFIRSGGISVNGVSITNHNHLPSVGDILQPDYLYLTKSRVLMPRAKLRQLHVPSFIYYSESSEIFTIVRWPFKFELREESSFSERWLRYYVRYFPTKRGKYRPPKTVWLKY